MWIKISSLLDCSHRRPEHKNNFMFYMYYNDVECTCIFYIL